MMTLLRIDEFFMLILAVAIVVIVQRSHAHVPFFARFLFYATAFFAVSLFWRDVTMGNLIPGGFYWARLGFDFCLSLMLVLWAFLPDLVRHILTPAAKRSPIGRAVHSDRDTTGVNRT